MKITYLDVLLRLAEEGRSFLIWMWQRIYNGVHWFVVNVLRTIFFFFVLIAVALFVVWSTVGCVPTSYMAYKGAQKEEVEYNKTEERNETKEETEQDKMEGRNKTKEFIMTLFESGCVPAWVYAEERNFVTVHAVGCQGKKQELLPKLFQ